MSQFSFYPEYDGHVMTNHIASGKKIHFIGKYASKEHVIPETLVLRYGKKNSLTMTEFLRAAGLRRFEMFPQVEYTLEEITQILRVKFGKQFGGLKINVHYKGVRPQSTSK